MSNGDWCGLAFGTIAIGLAVAVLTFIFTTHQPFNVFLMFGGTPIICGLIAIMDIRPDQGHEPNDLGRATVPGSRNSGSFCGALQCCSAQPLCQRSRHRPDLTFVVEMFGVVCLGWLTLRLLRPVDGAPLKVSP
jgi:hypothetical protein